MTRRITLAAALAAILASGTTVLAQPSPQQQSAQQPVAPPLPPPPPPPPPGTPPPPPPPPGTPSSAEGVDLSVEVTISRYQEDQLVSSLPYVLAVTSSTDDRSFGPSRSPSSLRMGAEVPVLTMLQPASPDGVPVPGVHGGPFTYRPVGTQIDCFASGVGDDRYRVTVIIEESSVYGADATAMETIRAPGVPVFRSFESSNTLVLRDGQSRQYTAAADRVTGESIRVDVALTVLD